MKKIFLAGSLFLLAIAGTAKAQASKKRDPPTDWLELPSPSFSASNGAKTVIVPGNRGTLKFDKNGDVFSNVVFVEAATMKDHRALLVNKFEKAVPQVPCKNPLPAACFQSADKSFAMCICKPTDLSNGETYTIALLLPAVQAARQAANGAKN